jgi:hypothetical protein
MKSRAPIGEDNFRLWENRALQCAALDVLQKQFHKSKNRCADVALVPDVPTRKIRA